MSASTSAAPRVLSLRALSWLLAVGLAVFVAVFAISVAVRIRTATAALDRGSAPIPYLFDEMSARSQSLFRAVVETHRRPASDPVTRVRAARAFRARLLLLSNRATPGRFADAPEAMRLTLARADDLVAQLQNRLIEYTALVELGRLDQAEARGLMALSLAADLERVLAEAQRQGVRDLVGRQQELTAVASYTLRAGVWWLAAGALLVVLLVGVVHGRVARPLGDLASGLARVARGELAARVVVRRADELGKLAGHFNEMTAVLQRRADEQGRYAAAGELLAGVAHEVNNPLMAIAATAEGRLADETLGGFQRREYTLILRQARRAGKLLQGLLRFVRPGEERADGVDVNAVLREAMDLVSYRFKVEEITAESTLDAAPSKIRGQAGRIEQVFVNLLSNAVDALARGPTPRVLKVATWLEGDDVMVAVEDNGLGIRPEIAAQLFRPFATSKGGKGSGLGLYISREIARAAGGDVTVTPRPGRGTRFVVRLPACGACVGALPETAEPAGAEGIALGTVAPLAPRAPRTPLLGVKVLLVDDEEAVRSPVARYLRRRGAEVAEAGDGYEALGQVATDRPDVVVADLKMPRMDGPTLYANLVARDPDLATRVVFLSGDLSQLGQLAAMPALAERVLAKPLELADLEARILSLGTLHAAPNLAAEATAAVVQGSRRVSGAPSAYRASSTSTS